MIRIRLRLLFIVLAFSSGLAGCGGKAYVYEPIDSGRFLSAAERQSDGPIQVSAAVPGREETERLFGIDLYDQGIQPVWLQVENSADVLARYAPVSTDPEYFAPLEVAYMNRRGYSKESREVMNERFHNLAMPRYIAAGETRSGFVFTHADPGAKGFNVAIPAQKASTSTSSVAASRATSRSCCACRASSRTTQGSTSARCTRTRWPTSTRRPSTRRSGTCRAAAATVPAR
jgi:hypothetical protein